MHGASACLPIQVASDPDARNQAASTLDSREADEMDPIFVRCGYLAVQYSRVPARIVPQWLNINHFGMHVV